MKAHVTCIYHDSGSTEQPVTHGLSVAWAVLKIRIDEEFLKAGNKKKQ
jgi:hypothetical protein